jgi:hypothetical protein
MSVSPPRRQNSGHVMANCDATAEFIPSNWQCSGPPTTVAAAAADFVLLVENVQDDSSSDRCQDLLLAVEIVG